MFRSSVGQKPASHRVGSTLREAGCLMSRSKEERSESKPGRSPRSTCQHCSIREWRAEGQLGGAGRRYWSATAFITCREIRREQMMSGVYLKGKLFDGLTGVVVGGRVHKGCSTHHGADEQRKSILELLRMFLCGREGENAISTYR
ncbi:hypothetical protein EYF80_008777 [Liparis tanakae]|uniref:Uncharacterized protein n=1 Tax=Liparis tanakae TaxID=230148 RepID=A0A4Z2ITH0_9TELE|nr:hypothetical protein EYF80_008777 [Liparis tanakae]